MSSLSEVNRIIDAFCKDKQIDKQDEFRIEVYDKCINIYTKHKVILPNYIGDVRVRRLSSNQS